MRGISALIVGLFCSFLHAQDLPNNSFENGSGNSVGSWITTENIYGISDTIWTRRDTVFRTNGLYSVELISDTFLATGNESAVIPAVLMQGTLHHITGNTNATISPIYYPHRPDTLFFDYKYVPTNNDSAGFQFIFSKADSILLNLSRKIYVQNSWKTDTILLTSLYSAPDLNPDSLFVQFRSSVNASTAQLGSKLWIDNIRLRIDSTHLISAIATVSAGELSVYPNPASEILFVELDENFANAEIEIFDLQGKLVLRQKAISGKNALKTANFRSGFYVLQVHDFTQQHFSRKRILITH